MSGSFKQLEAPVRYYNSNGVSFGYVIRVVGFSRTTYLNYLNGMQQDLMVNTATGYGIVSAIFKTIEEAHETAKRYYDAWGKEYDFGCISGVWFARVPSHTATNCLETVESQVMEFI